MKQCNMWTLRILKEPIKYQTIGGFLFRQVNKFICHLIGHSYKGVGRANGEIWGWNRLECERCKKKSDSLTDYCT